MPDVCTGLRRGAIRCTRKRFAQPLLPSERIWAWLAMAGPPFDVDPSGRFIGLGVCYCCLYDNSVAGIIPNTTICMITSMWIHLEVECVTGWLTLVFLTNHRAVGVNSKPGGPITAAASQKEMRNPHNQQPSGVSRWCGWCFCFGSAKA